MRAQAKLTRDSFHVFQANARNALKQSEQVSSILICAGTGCIAGGAMKIYENIKAECEKRGIPGLCGAQARYGRGEEPPCENERLPRLLRNGPAGPY